MPGSRRGHSTAKRACVSCQIAKRVCRDKNGGSTRPCARCERLGVPCVDKADRRRRENRGAEPDQSISMVSDPTSRASVLTTASMRSRSKGAIAAAFVARQSQLGIKRQRDGTASTEVFGPPLPPRKPPERALLQMPGSGGLEAQGVAVDAAIVQQRSLDGANKGWNLPFDLRGGGAIAGKFSAATTAPPSSSDRAASQFSTHGQPRSKSSAAPGSYMLPQPGTGPYRSGWTAGHSHHQAQVVEISPDSMASAEPRSHQNRLAKFDKHDPSAGTGESARYVAGTRSGGAEFVSTSPKSSSTGKMQPVAHTSTSSIGSASSSGSSHADKYPYAGQVWSGPSRGVSVQDKDVGSWHATTAAAALPPDRPSHPSLSSSTDQSQAAGQSCASDQDKTHPSGSTVPVVVESDSFGAAKITYAARHLEPSITRWFEPHGSDWIVVPPAVERALSARILPGGKPDLPLSATTMTGWQQLRFSDAVASERISRMSRPCFRMTFDISTLGVTTGHINASAAKLIGFNEDLQVMEGVGMVALPTSTPVQLHTSSVLMLRALLLRRPAVEYDIHMPCFFYDSDKGRKECRVAAGLVPLIRAGTEAQELHSIAGAAAVAATGDSAASGASRSDGSKAATRLTPSQQSTAIALIHHFIAQRMVTKQRKQRARSSFEWVGSVPRSVTTEILDSGREVPNDEALGQLPPRVGFASVYDLIVGLGQLFGKDAVRQLALHATPIPEAREALLAEHASPAAGVSLALQYQTILGSMRGIVRGNSLDMLHAGLAEQVKHLLVQPGVGPRPLGGGSKPMVLSPASLALLSMSSGAGAGQLALRDADGSVARSVASLAESLRSCELDRHGGVAGAGNGSLASSLDLLDDRSDAGSVSLLESSAMAGAGGQFQPSWSSQRSASSPGHPAVESTGPLDGGREEGTGRSYGCTGIAATLPDATLGGTASVAGSDAEPPSKRMRPDPALPNDVDGSEAAIRPKDWSRASRGRGPPPFAQDSASRIDEDSMSFHSGLTTDAYADADLQGHGSPRSLPYGGTTQDTNCVDVADTGVQQEGHAMTEEVGLAPGTMGAGGLEDGVVQGQQSLTRSMGAQGSSVSSEHGLQRAVAVRQPVDRYAMFQEMHAMWSRRSALRVSELLQWTVAARDVLTRPESPQAARLVAEVLEGIA